MTNKLGIYWSVSHRRPADYDYFQRLQPSVIKVMDPGIPDIEWIAANLPDSLVVARIHALSEQHEDMLKNPNHTGQRHAEEWWNHSQRLGFDRAKTLVLGVNEPRVWESGVPEALRQYTIAMCERASQLGLRVGAMQMGVGWPNNKGPDTLPDWSLWEGVENAIRRNNGALVCHEYWADQGPSENWGWWAGRALKCPWQVPIVIGECGVDMYVKDASVPHASRGWRGRMEPERYARELAEYTGRMSVDSRFVGDAVFASDYAAQEWFSFDIEPAYQAILATPIPTPTTPIPPPYVPTDAEVLSTPLRGFVTATVLNVRSGPSTDYPVVAQLAHGDAVTVTARAGNGAKWNQIGAERWVYSGWISFSSAPPPPAGDTWTRSIAFVRRWEGGWADDPNDPGGATNKGITIGTYTRWRAEHGQSVPTKEDLRAITDEEANKIFYEWYWLKSGADKLPWPQCLATFDLAVNGGVGRALEAFAAVGHNNFLAYMAWRLEWYCRLDGFKHFGRAWARRVADLMRVGAE